MSFHMKNEVCEIHRCHCCRKCCTCNSDVCYCNCCKGDKGDIGPTGPQGLQGPIGIQGLKGDKGDTGSMGPQGLQGPAGIQGLKGDKGDIGPAGPQGLQGQAGTQGLKGDKGDTGSAGPQGLPGSAGTQGLKGDKGDAGSAGPKGEKGDQGSPASRNLEYAFLVSQQEQVLQYPDSNIVLLERQVYMSSGITYEDGMVNITVPGIYRFTYELYPSSGASSNTQFRFNVNGFSTLGGDAWYQVDNTLVSSTFLLPVRRPMTFSIVLIGPNEVTIPARTAGVKLTINQTGDLPETL